MSSSFDEGLAAAAVTHGVVHAQFSTTNRKPEHILSEEQQVVGVIIGVGSSFDGGEIIERRGEEADSVITEKLTSGREISCPGENPGRKKFYVRQKPLLFDSGLLLLLARAIKGADGRTTSDILYTLTQTPFTFLRVFCVWM